MAKLHQDLDLTKTQLAVFFIVLLLSVDEINPVKIVLKVFPSLAPWHIAALAVLLMVYVFLSEVKQVVYFAIKTFFYSILSIFFRQVEVIGRENIPRYGPVIFTANHANQFVDGVMIMCTCEHKVSYLMAEASWKRRIVGDIAWALDVVPVKRAQDTAKSGTGKIRTKNNTNKGTDGDDSNNNKDEKDKDAAMDSKVTIEGIDTKFMTELKLGDKIRPLGTPTAFKVTQIIDDVTLEVDTNEDTPMSALPDKEHKQFDILKKVDTKLAFAKVLDRLADCGAVGIFPEGGSHDRTELLPLKVGIALIAYSALERNGINVPIVPVGLSYFRAHRWRGRAVVEYGRPILIDPSTLPDYRAGGAAKRAVCNKLMDEIESSMKSVLISAPDYETLELIHTARRLYQRKKGPMDALEKQQLTRRFAEGYKRLLLMVNGKPPKEWIDLQERVKAYRAELRDLGLKDYQVISLTSEHLDEGINVENVDGDKVLSILQLLYQIIHAVIIIAIAAVPGLLINLPVGVLAGLYSERKRAKALAKSKVKIRGYDVMLTEKIIFCMVMVPTLWFYYGFLLYKFTNLDWPAISLFFFSFPLFAYMGIVVADAGIMDMRNLRFYAMRLSPSARKRLAQLPETRRQLQDDLKDFIRKIGPALGEIYYGDDLNWKKIMDKSTRAINEDGEESKKDQ